MESATEAVSFRPPRPKETLLATVTLSLDKWGNLLVGGSSVNPEIMRKELDSLNAEDGYENSHVIAGAVRLFEETYNKLNQDVITYIKTV